MTSFARVLVATTNHGKLREFSDCLSGSGIALVGLADLGADPSFHETGATFVENSSAKALHYHLLHGLPTVSDDSGLVVEALGGDPGVGSSRYLGESADYAAKMSDILRRLAENPSAPRDARFTCCVSLAAGGSVVANIVKHVFGLIATEPRGGGGFGYDPIFYCPELNATFADAPPAAKHSVSHRGQALSALRILLDHHPAIRGAIGLDVNPNRS